MCMSRTPLLTPEFHYIEGETLEHLQPEGWDRLGEQRNAFLAARRADQVFRMFETLRDQPSFGYEVNMFRHGLQCASQMLRDGHGEDTVVVALLHDFAYDFCVDTHGEAAAQLIGPFATERDEFLLRAHQDFLTVHCPHHHDVDPTAREKWRGHPHFEWVEAFVDRYDQRTITAGGLELPLETFRPMVHRFFERPIRSVRRGP
jgi:predicted HD phosphohydrolase